MMQGILSTGMILFVLTCAGCGDPGTEHVWQDQTDMIERSRGVETLLQDASRQQRREIDEMAQ